MLFSSIPKPANAASQSANKERSGAFRFIFGASILFCWLHKELDLMHKVTSGQSLTVSDNPTIMSGRVDEITQLLQNQKKKYYVYNNTNMTLPHIRAMAKNSSRPTGWGTKKWFARFKSYGLGELRFIESLETSMSPLRTFDIDEAAFVIVPIPLSAAIYWGQNADVALAFDHLLHNEHFFKAHPQNHLFFAIIEKLLRADMITTSDHLSGLSLQSIAEISKGILVQDFDTPLFRRFVLNHSSSDWGQIRSTLQVVPLFQYQWSLGYAQECSDPKYPFIDVEDFHKWNSKNISIFYRTTKGTSMYNSTNYRHALVNDHVELELHFPNASVGYQIQYDQWLSDLQNSKYCLVVRGDNPSSRSLYTAVRVGCMPLIVSNSLPFYQPMFRSLLRYEDFSIMVEEEEFVSSPSESLKNAISTLTEEELKKKIHGLSLLQRILVLDHPKSLFISAFVHETITRQKDIFPYIFNEGTNLKTKDFRALAKSFDRLTEPLWQVA